MEMEIVVPNELPVMTLPGVAFFPQALLPLHIFEPRYRQMLSDVLAKDRLMAVVGLDTSNSAQEAAFEPPPRSPPSASSEPAKKEKMAHPICYYRVFAGRESPLF